jgi:hypothetical protein
VFGQTKTRLDNKTNTQSCGVDMRLDRRKQDWTTKPTHQVSLEGITGISVVIVIRETTHAIGCHGKATQVIRCHCHSLGKTSYHCHHVRKTSYQVTLSSGREHRLSDVTGKQHRLSGVTIIR